jgi:hypothetical protein
MKHKKIQGKLFLNKQTISNLMNHQMARVNGNGVVVPIPAPVVSDPQHLTQGGISQCDTCLCNSRCLCSEENCEPVITAQPM